MHSFRADIQIIGINPFVFVPDEVLTELFLKSGKDKGPIPIRGQINGNPYTQTLVKYQGAWRLYINMQMLKDSPRRIGEVVDVTIEVDPSDRTIALHPKLAEALAGNPDARDKFNSLTPSRQKEIIRYISFLKTEESVDRNVKRAMDSLLGKGSFVGRNQSE